MDSLLKRRPKLIYFAPGNTLMPYKLLFYMKTQMLSWFPTVRGHCAFTRAYTHLYTFLFLPSVLTQY